MIETARLKLVPATVAHVRAELGDAREFARLLGASVPQNWPPDGVEDALPLFLDWLEAAPAAVGWYSWYVLDVGDRTATPVLIGSGDSEPYRVQEIRQSIDALSRKTVLPPIRG